MKDQTGKSKHEPWESVNRKVCTCISKYACMEQGKGEWHTETGNVLNCQEVL